VALLVLLGIQLEVLDYSHITLDQTPQEEKPKERGVGRVKLLSFYFNYPN